ncbi:MAG: PEP-CTERM sorting domain-containing protein, partial [Betaproteobacteria bacterium]
GANQERFTVALDSVVPAHGFIVFGRIADQSINGGYAPGVTWGNALSLGNASDYLRLENGDGTLLSEISWSGSSAGASLEVHGGVLPTLVPADLQPTPAGFVYGLGDRGTPGLANSVDFGVTSLAPVPEPSTYALLAAGLAALTVRQARRRVAA